MPLIEFAYNNSYHSSIQMAPYEALYGRKCRSPIGWFDVGETKLIGTDMIQQAIDKVKLIQERLLAARVDRSHMQITGVEIWSFRLVTGYS